MKIRTLAVAVPLCLAASAALAESIDTTVTLLPGAQGTFSAAFGAAKTQSGLFVDTFMFQVPGSGGSVTVGFGPISGNVVLSVGTLASPDGQRYAESPPAGIDTSTLLSIADVMGPLTLTLLGAAGDPFSPPVALSGSYAGTISFVPAAVAVPQPATLALLAAGLGALALAARRSAQAGRRLARMRVVRPER